MHSKHNVVCNYNTISFSIVDIQHQSEEEQEDQPLVDRPEDDILSSEEDEQAVKREVRLKQLKEMIFDTDIAF